jgi:hypothetical protein
MPKKTLSQLTDDELLKAYGFVIYELNDARKRNDVDGIKFYEKHKKLVDEVMKQRHLYDVLKGVNDVGL